MTFSRTDVLCYATLPDGHGFENTVAAAAGAGFTGLSLWLMSIDAGREELGSLEAVRDCLDRYGMQATCLELLLAWPSGDESAAEGEVAVMQAAAEVLEPEVIMAACMEPALDQNATSLLKRQCQSLAPLKVALEFLPWTAIPDIATARQLVESIDEDNLGYVFDSWHFARSGLQYEALASLPGERIHFIQLSDAPEQAGPDILAETLGGRLAPGEGVVDWARLRAILQASGVDCPISTEQYSDRVKAMSLEDACHFLYRSLEVLRA
jgi:sugar phosphate isomerase/epimerase